MSLDEYRNYEEFMTSQQLQSPHEVFPEYPPRVTKLTYETCREVHSVTP